MTSRPSTAAPILAVLAVMMATLAAYVGGYLWLGELSTRNLGIAAVNGVKMRQLKLPCRHFHNRWQASLFSPAAQVESWFRGVDIEAMSSDD